MDDILGWIEGDEPIMAKVTQWEYDSLRMERDGLERERDTYRAAYYKAVGRMIKLRTYIEAIMDELEKAVDQQPGAGWADNADMIDDRYERIGEDYLCSTETPDGFEGDPVKVFVPDGELVRNVVYEECDEEVRGWVRQDAVYLDKLTGDKIRGREIKWE